jgi:hypothetical protein
MLSLMFFVLLTKVASSLATSEPKIMSMFAFCSTITNFQLILREIESNHGD